MSVGRRQDGADMTDLNLSRIVSSRSLLDSRTHWFTMLKATELSTKTMFIEKVLKRLFAATPSTSHVPVPSREEMVLKNPASKPEQKDSETAQASSACASSPDGENEILLPRRLYTVSLPPDGYVPSNPRTNTATNAENSESSDGATEEDSQRQPKKKHIRRKKQKNTIENPDNLHGEQTASGKHEFLFQNNLQLQQTDGTKINKNKKRKMKKKRQKEKMRAAGLLTKTTGVDFTYQPEKGSEEGADFEDIYEKADGILDFLQATQEIYFADNKSKCTDSVVKSATIQEILQHLESHSMASSDVALLHQMKSLVLLQDIERLQGALEQFQEHSMMLPDCFTLCGNLPVFSNSVHNIINVPVLEIIPKNTYLIKGLKLRENSGKMVIRLRRITPGYIRLLQTQAAGKIVINTTDILMQRTALFLGMFGISLSGYSTRRLTQEKRLPSPWLFSGGVWPKK